MVPVIQIIHAVVDFQQDQLPAVISTRLALISGILRLEDSGGLLHSKLSTWNTLLKAAKYVNVHR